MNPLAKENVADVYPLSPIQESMLFHNLLTPEDSPYQEQIVHDLSGEVNPELFGRAWNLLVERHAILRTVFAEGRKQPLQLMLRVRPVALQVLDLTALDAATQRRHLPTVWDQDARAPLSVRKGPLFRLLLVALSRHRFKFLWTFNHIVLDGWSSALLMADLAALYGALARGRPLPVPDFVPFRNYIAWLAGRDRDEARAYWKRQLSGFTVATALPSAGGTAAPGPSRRRLLRQRTVLTAAVSAELRALARRRRVTSGIVVQAAWTVLLARFSGAPEVVFGLTVAGRPAELAGAERMVGPLINTLPVRAPADASLPLADLLHTLQQQFLNTLHFDDLPLFEVQASSEIKPPEKLFDSLLDIHIQPRVTRIAFDGFELCLEGVHEGSGGTSFSLAADVVLEEAIEAELFADPVLLGRPSLVRLARSLESVLRSLAVEPQARLGELEVMAASERWQVVGEWSGGEAMAPPFGSGVHELFAAQARRTPDGLAAEHGGEQVSYGELARRAAAVAGWLRGRGVAGEERVGVFGERGVGMLAALLGIYQSGGAYLPLDPGHPDARLAAVLIDSGARLVLTESGLAGRVQELGAAVGRRLEALCWDGMPPGPGAAEPEAVSAGCAGAHALANVFYTSGSTGAPKGALVEHGGLLAHLWAKIALLGIGAPSVVAQNASHGFDISIWQLLSPLVVGGRVVIYADEVAQEPDTFLARIERDGVTVLETVPSLLEPMLSMVPEGVRLAALRRMVSNAEVLPVSLYRRWRERFPRIPVVNTYGATECSDDVTHVVLDRPGPGVQRLDVGRPIPGLRVYVLDGELRPVPLGWPGQVAFAGVGLGRGYLADAARTARSFVPDPLADEEEGGRLYLTGDLGCFGPRGELVFLRRIDDQVKVRGHRIELGEVEAALWRLAGVRQAAALVRPDGAGQNRLVGYVVGEAGLDAAAVRLGLRAVLPEAMIPEQYVFLAALPVNRNGKVDRRALAALAPPDLDTQGARHVEPRPGLEQTLAAVWREVLQVERVGAHDNFFDLGGHSLRTIRVRSRLQQQLGIELPLRALFDHPTVARLADAVRPLLPERVAGSCQRIPRLPEADVYPLSHSQKRLWMRHRLAPGSSAYNLTGIYRIEDDLTPETLVAALRWLTRRHEILRTSYRLRDGEPVQVILPLWEPDLELQDLGGTDDQGAKDPGHLTEVLLRDALTPYDLTAPPVRTRLVRLGDRRYLLQISLHHIAADLWSWQIIEHDLTALYRALSAGRSAADALPPLPIRYVDYAAWNAAGVEGQALAQLERFWLDRLSGELPVLAVPADRPPSPDRTFEVHEVVSRIPSTAAARLRALQREAGTTLLVATLAMTTAWLHRITGQSDLILGTPATGRSHVDLEGLVGFFVNILPIRSDSSGQPTVRELLHRVDRVTLDALTHEAYPFDLLVERLNPQRISSGRTPICSVLFALREVESDPGISRWMVPYAHELSQVSRRRSSDFDLEITFMAEGDLLSACLSCSADLFDRATALRFATQIGQLVESAALHPERRMADLDLMRPAEIQQVNREFNDTTAVTAGSECLHERIESQVAGTPDRIAVAAGAQCLTYSGLDVLADGVAHHLMDLGLSPEARVGICAERSLEMVVGLLGILKAGAAFVPIDPDYPRLRLAQMFMDAQIDVILAQPHLVDRLPVSGQRIVSIGQAELSSLARSARREIPARRCHGESLAYVLYTSGSTGRPKGAMNQHRSIVNTLVWTQHAFGMTGDSMVVLHKAPLSFDISLWEVFGPLMLGARLVLSAPGRHRDPKYLAQVMADERVTAVQFVPTMLQAFFDLNQGVLGESLLHLLAGGEQLPRQLVEQFRSHESQAAFYNQYGPTEAAIAVTWWQCTAEPEASIPIGRPSENVQIFLTDSDLHLVAIGVAGELLVGGIQLARGYLGLPDLTASRFVPDPFSGRESARLYRTGDLARRRTDGAIEFLGRLDDQVKVRGQRVELGEVEAALSRCPGVRACAAAVHRGSDGSLDLVGYVVADQPLATRELRERLTDELPTAAVPQHFVQLEALPTLPNGKLNRRALPLPVSVRGEDTQVERPRDELEHAMAAIWEEVLQINGIGIHSDFFQVGGQSIRAVALLARVADRLKTELPMDALFRHPTIAGLCGLVRDQLRFPLQDSSSLVLLQAAPSPRPPLFLIHPHGGEVFSYRPLAEALGCDQSVYGLRSRGLDSLDRGGEEPLTTIDAMAQHYLEEMRRVWPRGPYCLGGWSYGGIVAFEIARRLETAGERVELLALLDVRPPQAQEGVHEADLGLGRLAQLFFALDETRFQGMDEGSALALILQLRPEHPVVAFAGTVDRLRRVVAVLRANTLAVVRHRLSGQVRTDLHLFLAGSGTHVPDPDLWRPWTLGSVRTFTLPGDHHQMLAPAAVAVLAPRLRELLSRVVAAEEVPIVSEGAQKKFLLVIPDGAGDVHRVNGKSPLAEASIPYWEEVASAGVCGLMQTLYDDLPRGSIVALLGMLGWDPHLFSGHGRASWELLALSEVKLFPGDLVFRANLAQVVGRRLISYNAGFILSEEALPLVERVNAALRDEFPRIELHHNRDFRNSLILRDAHVNPALLICPEPHDHEGMEFDLARLIGGKDPKSQDVASLLNAYLARVAEILCGETANMIFPWSASCSVSLPAFWDHIGFHGRTAIVGSMDFLQGIARSAGIEFFKVGNGRPDTDYVAKGVKVIELFEGGCSFVICHINSPDEASHMHDREGKIQCLEAIDRHIIGPAVQYFRSRMEELGGVMIVPDHYTNLLLDSTREGAHSLHPVPFALWNGRDRDEVTRFHEDAVRHGLYGDKPVSHLELLRILGVSERGVDVRPRVTGSPFGEFLEVPEIGGGRQPHECLRSVPGHRRSVEGGS